MHLDIQTLIGQTFPSNHSMVMKNYIISKYIDDKKLESILCAFIFLVELFAFNRVYGDTSSKLNLVHVLNVKIHFFFVASNTNYNSNVYAINDIFYVFYVFNIHQTVLMRSDKMVFLGIHHIKNSIYGKRECSTNIC